MLIALGGRSAVGKTTLARSLSRRIGALYLRADTIEQAMRNTGFDVSGPEGYLVARAIAEDNLRSGHSVIVDSVNPVEITRDYWRETAARLVVELVEIEVVCSDTRQHRLRVESRVTEIPGLVHPTWQQVVDRHYEPWTTAQVVDTAGCTIEDALSQVEAIIRRH
jgi:predicted kinase